MSNPIKQSIPNFVTILNLLCGSIAIVLAIQGQVKYAGYLIILATVFDFFDGFLARKLNVMSELGKQLDSLSDLISFGMAPTAIMYESMRYSLKLVYGSNYFQQTTLNIIILGTSFLIVIFSALRLAKFNVSTNQKYNFVGVPTPAFALLVASFPIINAMVPENLVVINAIFKTLGKDLPMMVSMGIIGIQIFVIEKMYFLLSVTILFSALLVANINIIAFKFQDFKYKNNKIRYNFFIYSLVLFIFLQAIAIPIIIFSHVIISIITAKSRKALTEFSLKNS